MRILGGGTKLGWGDAGARPGRRAPDGRLTASLEHNVGDLTAVLEAGVPLARGAGERSPPQGQMLALDPPLGADRRRRDVGGVFATADSGPLRHRYGGPA